MIDQIVATYVKLRDKKAQLKAAYDADVARIDEGLKKCEAFMLSKMQEQGVEAFKTPSGTAYKQTRTSATVADWDSLLNFVRGQDLWNLLEHRVSKTAVDEYRAANEDVPPGVNYRAETVVNFRRS